MFTKEFLTATAERAVKTFAQALVAVLGVGATDVLDVDWSGALSAAGLAALVSILTSVGTGAATDGSPSATHVEGLTGPPGGKHAAGSVHVIDEDQDQP